MAVEAVLGDDEMAGLAARTQRYRTLPDPVRVMASGTSSPVSPPPDPSTGRGPDEEFLLRYGGLS